MIWSQINEFVELRRQQKKQQQENKQINIPKHSTFEKKKDFAFHCDVVQVIEQKREKKFNQQKIYRHHIQVLTVTISAKEHTHF